MKISRWSLPAMAVAGLISANALAQNGNQSSAENKPSANTAQNSANSGEQASNNKNNNKAPEGFVLVDERIVVLTANEPQNHFLRAEDLLSRGDVKAARAEANIGAAYLDMQAARGGQNGSDQALTQCADHLRQVAKELQPLNNSSSNNAQQSNEQKNNNSNEANNSSQANGQQSEQIKQDQKQLSEAFAKANEALAQHFQGIANAELQSHKRIAAGHDLDAAATSLSAAYAWDNQSLPKQVATDVNDAHIAATDLMMPMENNAKQNNAQTAQNASSLDPTKAIDQLGKDVQQAQSSLAQNNNEKNSNQTASADTSHSR